MYARISHVSLRHFLKMQEHWLLECKWPKDSKYSSIKQIISRWSCQSPVHPPLRNCKQMSTIFTFYIQSARVLNVVALENTNSLWINIVIMCACIVHGVVFLYVSFTSSFKISKISHHCKAPLSCIQITLLRAQCRPMYVLVSLWISLFHATWHLCFLQHKSNQIVLSNQILALCI